MAASVDNPNFEKVGGRSAGGSLDSLAVQASYLSQVGMGCSPLERGSFNGENTPTRLASEQANDAFS